MFTKQEQLIPIPEHVDRQVTIGTDQIPDPISPYLGMDEQSSLTRIRYMSLLDGFTGYDCYHLKSHVGMRVDNREAEINDIYIGVVENGKDHALIIEAKSDGENLNKNQLI